MEFHCLLPAVVINILIFIIAEIGELLMFVVIHNDGRPCQFIDL